MLLRARRSSRKRDANDSRSSCAAGILIMQLTEPLLEAAPVFARQGSFSRRLRVSPVVSLLLVIVFACMHDPPSDTGIMWWPLSFFFVGVLVVSFSLSLALFFLHFFHFYLIHPISLFFLFWLIFFLIRLFLLSICFYIILSLSLSFCLPYVVPFLSPPPSAFSFCLMSVPIRAEVEKASLSLPRSKGLTKPSFDLFKLVRLFVGILPCV